MAQNSLNQIVVDAASHANGNTLAGPNIQSIVQNLAPAQSQDNLTSALTEALVSTSILVAAGIPGPPNQEVAAVRLSDLPGRRYVNTNLLGASLVDLTDPLPVPCPTISSIGAGQRHPSQRHGGAGGRGIGSWSGIRRA